MDGDISKMKLVLYWTPPPSYPTTHSSPLTFLHSFYMPSLTSLLCLYYTPLLWYHRPLLRRHRFFLYVINNPSSLICHQQPLFSYMSSTTPLLLYVINNPSSLICHQQPLFSYMSSTTPLLLYAINNPSSLICHQQPLFYVMYYAITNPSIIELFYYDVTNFVINATNPSVLTPFCPTVIGTKWKPLRSPVWDP